MAFIEEEDEQKQRGRLISRRREEDEKVDIGDIRRYEQKKREEHESWRQKKE